MKQTGTRVVVTIFIEEGQSAVQGVRVDIAPASRPVPDDAAWRPEGSHVDSPLGARIPPGSATDADSSTGRLSSVPAYWSDAGREVVAGAASRWRLLVAGVVAAAVVVAAFTVVSPRSGRTRAAASSGSTSATSTSPAAVGEATATSAPVICRGDAPATPEGCTPTGGSPTAFAVVAANCLSLIRTAAHAMSVDLDTYARAVVLPANGRTVDEEIHEQLDHARLFLVGEHDKTGTPVDPDLAARLDAFDAAIRMAETTPCSETPMVGSGSTGATTTSAAVPSGRAGV
jgi:hypothetical protein